MIPASADFDPPSPKANISPPITMDTSANPRAIGPVNAADKFATASTQGDVPCARTSDCMTATAATTIANTRRVPCIVPPLPVSLGGPSSSRHTRPHTMHTGRMAECPTGGAMVTDRGRPVEGVSVTPRRRRRAR